ncbi:MAG TPA: PrgI family protein, partial [bacterium]|nr:PrgI family protein [bacterium]
MPSAQMPQSNVQHAVPQNIMDVEFKLIGELTMRQFSYLLVFGLLAYFSTNIPGLFKWPAVLFFAILAIGLAFVPVQERGLDEWLVNFYRAITSPTQRVWKKEPQIPTAFLYDNLAVVQHELITLTPTSSRRKLEDYLKTTLEEGSEDPLD